MSPVCDVSAELVRRAYSPGLVGKVETELRYLLVVIPNDLVAALRVGLW